MQIYGINSKSIHEIDFPNSGKNTSTCPLCSHNRRKKHEKCLKFDVSKEVGFCQHCEERFVKYNPYAPKKEYTRPEWIGFSDLREDWVKSMEDKRGISKATLNKMKVSMKTMFIPQTGKNEQCIAYPYFIGDQLINTKYRAAGKNFRMESGSELIWYNYDAINKFDTITICEGENDALVFIEDGYDNVISVPNGASTSSMSYLDSSIKELDKIKKFYIAVDNDEKGIELRDELVRRLGANRCFLVNFEQYKDANEYFVANGRGSLKSVLDRAKQPRIDGIIQADDIINDLQVLFEHGLQRGLDLGFEPLDKHLSWESSKLLVLSGTPSSGKSELADFIATKLNTRHGWKAAFYSPENLPISTHYAKIYEKIVGKRFRKSDSDPEFWETYEHIKDNYFWVDDNEVSDLDAVLDKFEHFIKVKGVKVCVLDPWNKIAGGTEFNKQGELINKLVKFERKHNVLFILVAHPRKLGRSADGTYPMANAYDIAGTSDFYNMADYIIIAKREQDIETMKFTSEVKWSIQKVKFRHLGDQELIHVKFNYVNGRYEGVDTPQRGYDLSNWLNKGEIEENPIKNLDANLLISNFENRIEKKVESEELTLVDIEDIPF